VSARDAQFEGYCHCGAVTVAIALSRPTDQIELRACQCLFCRHHGAKTLADPEGKLSIEAAPGELNRYRFGLRTADFLLCATCGCYIAAVIEDGGQRRAVLNVVGAGLAEFSETPARPVNYDRENVAARRARRLRTWMPVEIIERGRAVAV
jgi:hypothetical protein